jgi:hypothetical protein
VSVSVQGRSKDVRLLQGLNVVLKRLAVEGLEEEAGLEESGAAVECEQSWHNKESVSSSKVVIIMDF